MKNWLLILLMLPISVFGQKEASGMPKNQNGVIEFTEVVTVDSVSAKDLYSRARLFVAKAFVSATDVTKLEDDNTGTIVTKGLLPRNYINPLNRSQGGNVAFSFTIQCREGRCKYSITNLIHKDDINSRFTGGPLERDKPACGTFNIPRSSWAKIKNETADHIARFIIQLKATLKGDAAFSSSEYW